MRKMSYMRTADSAVLNIRATRVIIVSISTAPYPPSTEKAGRSVARLHTYPSWVQDLWQVG